MFKYNRLIGFIIFALLVFIACDNPADSDDDDHFEPIGLYIMSGNDTLVTYQGGVVNGAVTVAAGDTTETLQIMFISEDGDVLIPDDEDIGLDWEIGNMSIADVLSDAAKQSMYQINIIGKSTGQTTITIILNHHGHKDFESLPVNIIVQ